MANDKSEQYLLQTADNALAILDLLADSPPLSLTEIALRTGHGKTMTLRLLYTLERRGYLKRGEDNRYSLGMRLYTLGSIVISKHSFLQPARRILDDLTEAVSETAHLVTWENVRRVILLYESLPANQSLRTESARGHSSRLPHMTSTGIALLAALPESEAEKYADSVSFERVNDHSILTREQLLEEIRRTRETGFSLNDQRYEIGMTSVAVAVPDPSSPSSFAISVSGPSVRIEDNLEEIKKRLKEAAGRIGSLLQGE